VGVGVTPGPLPPADGPVVAFEHVALQTPLNAAPNRPATFMTAGSVPSAMPMNVSSPLPARVRVNRITSRPHDPWPGR
jgi:hypothetical protein